MSIPLYRLAPGTVSYATLTSTAGYLVSSFPNTGVVNSWSVATNGVIALYRDRVLSPSGVAIGLGGLSLNWDFGILNREQAQYFLDTYAAGALTAAVTLYTWRFNNQSASGNGRNWVALTALMRVDTGKVSEGTDNINDLWYRGFRLNFSRCAIVPEP